MVQVAVEVVMRLAPNWAVEVYLVKVIQAVYLTRLTMVAQEGAVQEQLDYLLQMVQVLWLVMAGQVLDLQLAGM